MNCNNYFDMTDQGDSFETWQGLRGPAGPQGPAGAPGAPGTSVELRGPVETTGDLPATASSSELWLVGSAAPYHGWFYNGEAWEDAGEIAVGPTGPQGPAGQDGTAGSDGVTFTPTVSSAGVISWTNDGSLPNPDPVDIKGPQGSPGAAGSDGVTFTPTVSSAGVISWTNDGGLPNPDPVDIIGPRGPQGRTGATGPQGATGATGPAGPGVPTGGTAGQVLKKTSSTDYDTAWGNEDLGITGATVGKVPVISAVDGNGVPTAFAPGDGGDVTADMLGIVIDGNSTPVGAAVGQYVIVKNSTISGITDGLYTAAQAIPANTAIDSTYLTAVSGGGFNNLQNDLQEYAKSSSMISLTLASGFSLASVWGTCVFFRRGNIGFVYASGLRSSSKITNDVAFTTIPYQAGYFLHSFPVKGSTDIGRVISDGSSIRINGIPANTDIFFGFSFPLDIS